MQTHNVKLCLVSFIALHADEIAKPETSINSIIVKKEPGTGSLFPINFVLLKKMVLHTKIMNKKLFPSSQFPVPDQQF